jgi:hypothetical protein
LDNVRQGKGKVCAVPCYCYTIGTALRVLETRDAIMEASKQASIVTTKTDRSGKVFRITYCFH